MTNNGLSNGFSNRIVVSNRIIVLTAGSHCRLLLLLRLLLLRLLLLLLRMNLLRRGWWWCGVEEGLNRSLGGVLNVFIFAFLGRGGSREWGRNMKVLVRFDVLWLPGWSRCDRGLDLGWGRIFQTCILSSPGRRCIGIPGFASSLEFGGISIGC